MAKFRIVSGPSELQCSHSFWASKADERTERSEVIFEVKDETETPRAFPLMIRGLKRIDAAVYGEVEIEANLYCANNEFRDLIFGQVVDPWACFKGRYNVSTKTGSLEQVRR